MADGAKVVINLATGLEDPERVTVAFLVGGAAADQGKQVAMFLTKEAVRLAVPLITDEDLQILEELYARMVAAASGDEQLAARERFYSRLYSITGRPRLVAQISRLRQEIARSLRWPTLQHAPEHHERFLEAIKAGDADGAAAQLASHYRRVAILIRRYLRDASVNERVTLATADTVTERRVPRRQAT